MYMNKQLQEGWGHGHCVNNSFLSNIISFVQLAGNILYQLQQISLSILSFHRHSNNLVRFFCMRALLGAHTKYNEQN